MDKNKHFRLEKVREDFQLDPKVDRTIILDFFNDWHLAINLKRDDKARVVAEKLISAANVIIDKDKE